MSMSHRKRRGKPRCRSAPAAIRIDKVVLKRKQWTNNAMEAAMNDVKSGKSSLSFAAKLHNVPRSTLHDHVLKVTSVQHYLRSVRKRNIMKRKTRSRESYYESKRKGRKRKS